MARKGSRLGQLVQKGFDSSIERARQKGNERLTIMLIPHGQEKMFSLQLNYQMIFFLAGILFLAVSLSFYGLYRKAQKEAEASDLRNRYGANFRGALQLREVSREMEEHSEQLLVNLREVLAETGVPDEEIESLPELSDSESNAANVLDREVIQKSRLGPGRNYLPAVYGLKGLAYGLKDQRRTLDATDRFVGRTVGGYAHMPMGRPFTEKEMRGLNDTSRFGPRLDPFTNAGFEVHMGQDISGPDGTPVRATGEGTVQSAGYDMGYGNRIVVKHESGFYSMYAHLQRILTQPGDPVRRGQVIGLMGRTGRVTGSHLHYEIWLGDQVRIDPAPYLCSYDARAEMCRAF